MRLEVEIKQLRALVALAEAGGVSRAALALGVSQSTVSENLLALERTLGAKVTVRKRGQGATLSVAGQALLPYARRILKDVAAASRAVSDLRYPGLRIGAAESLGSYILPQVLNQLQARWSGLEVQVTNGLCDDLRAGVLADKYDVALTLNGPAAGADSNSQLHIVDLFSSPLAIFAGSDSQLQQGPPLARSSLRGRTLLLPDPEGELYRSLQEWLKGERGLQLQSAGTVDGVKNGVLAGTNLGVLPSYAVALELARGEFRKLVLADPLPSLTVQAATLDFTRIDSPLNDLLQVLSRRAVAPDPEIVSV